MAFTLQNLIDAGLPAVHTSGQGKIANTQFSRTLTQTEWLTYLSISDPDEYDKIIRITNMNEFLNSSQLSGRDLSTINNNADRDDLLRAICFQLGLCNSSGIINSNYSEP